MTLTNNGRSWLWPLTGLGFVDPAALLLPIGRGLAMLWIVVVSVALAVNGWQRQTRIVSRGRSAMARSAGG